MDKFWSLNLERILSNHQWVTIAIQSVGEEFLHHNVIKHLHTSNLYRNLGQIRSSHNWDTMCRTIFAEKLIQMLLYMYMQSLIL